jgi:regulator of cell morphogenesis and NO signaling
MFLHSLSVTKESFISEIVRSDYRTAAVFKKHEIDFCCGAKWTLEAICHMKGIEFTNIKKELEHAARTIQLSNSIRFDSWSIDFLTDYIINVHHSYLRDKLPEIKQRLDHFAADHADKYPYINEVQEQFDNLCHEFIPHIAQEEDVLFPYIRQIAHAYDSKEPYASLLVRTLRKPIANVMEYEHDFISKTLQNIRKLTDNYNPPQRSCTSHSITYSLLRELDDDLVQHLFLENEILFPKAIAMERELLAKK